MKKYFLPFLIAICFVTACSNESKVSSDSETTRASNDPTPAAASTSIKSEDGKAIATIETNDYVIKIHRVIPFMPDATKTAGAFIPKEGNHFIALDMSVKSKSDKPFSMGNVFLASKITDEKGNEYGDLIGSMTAFNLTYPEQENQSENEAIWSTEFGPHEFHRSVALAFEAPKDVKSFTLTSPASDDVMKAEKKQMQFSIK